MEGFGCQPHKRKKYVMRCVENMEFNVNWNWMMKQTFQVSFKPHITIETTLKSLVNKYISWFPDVL